MNCLFIVYEMFAAKNKESKIAHISTLTLLHPRSQRQRSFWSAPRIATSGRVQCGDMRRIIVSYSQPIIFVRLDSEHAQIDGVGRTFPDVAILDALATPGKGFTTFCNIHFGLRVYL